MSLVTSLRMQNQNLDQVLLIQKIQVGTRIKRNQVLKRSPTRNRTKERIKTIKDIDPVALLLLHR